MKRSLLFLAALAAIPVARADERELTVFAAASLREVFDDLGKGFEAKNAGVKVRISYAGSQELRTQIEHGAKGDVFASADLKHMAALEKAGLVAASRVFTRNEPVIVVPKGNPAGVRALADLPKAKRLVIGTPEVPIGNYTLWARTSRTRCWLRWRRASSTSGRCSPRSRCRRRTRGSCTAPTQ